MNIDSPKKSNAGRKLFDGKNYDEVIPKLETAWGLDCTDAEAASLADISTAALSRFLKQHPAISERKSRLKEKSVLSARNALHKAINNGNAALALKYLERKRKDEFSTRQEFSQVPPRVPEYTVQQLARIINGENPMLVLKEKETMPIVKSERLNAADTQNGAFEISTRREEGRTDNTLS